MIELDKYIELLLLDHDCVILPDFGGFVVHDEAAYIDEEGMYYPPYRTLGFNVRLTVNDGLLVQSIMQTYDMDYPQALRMLEGAIKTVKKELRQNGEWEIGSLGTLALNESGCYEFEPLHEAGISTPNYYGLDVLDLHSFMLIEKLGDDSLKSNILPEEIVELENVVEEDEENSSVVSTYAKSFMKYAAVLVGAIALFFATSIPVHNINIANLDLVNSLMYAFPLKQAVENTVTCLKGVTPVIDSIENDDVKTVQTVVQETTKVDNNLDVESKPHEEIKATAQDDGLPKKGMFTIILASQVVKVNADHFINKLTSAGYKEGKFLDLGYINYVVYSSFDNLNSAYQKLNELKHDDHAFDDAWVLQIP